MSLTKKNCQESSMTNWINNRVAERTSWDGAALIAVGVVILFAGPFAKIAAYAAIAYGAWTIWKSEQNFKNDN